MCEEESSEVKYTEREREREDGYTLKRVQERERMESSGQRTEPPVKWRRSYKPHRCNDRLEDVFQSIWYGDGMDEYKPWKNAQAIAAIERFVRCMRADEGYAYVFHDRSMSV